MQRILNNPDDVVDEMLQGFLKAHPDIVEATEDGRVVRAKQIPEGKVGVITGGGSGHKPAFIGYVGKNLCDAAAVGEICSSPTAKAFLNAARTADQGRGVACLYGNYAGDNMNVKMAVRMARKEGIEIKTVIANDDVASAPKDQRDKRRGVAGEILMWKAGGAKAAQGAVSYTHLDVYKGQGLYRPLQYRDCVILLRSVSGWAETFVRVLQSEGIPAYSTSKSGYFSAVEVVTVLNYLRICDNPRQEIPYAAVLRSPIVGCTDRELALIRCHSPELPIYEASAAYEAGGEEVALREKLGAFSRQLRDIQSLSLIHI